MGDVRAKFYAAILFLPVAGFFLPHQTINDYAYFLAVIGLIVSAYTAYAWHPKSDTLDVVRKGVGCFSTALLILFLSAQVTYILTQVYHLDFAD